MITLKELASATLERIRFSRSPRKRIVVVYNINRVNGASLEKALLLMAVDAIVIQDEYPDGPAIQVWDLDRLPEPDLNYLLSLRSSEIPQQMDSAPVASVPENHVCENFRHPNWRVILCRKCHSVAGNDTDVDGFLGTLPPKTRTAYRRVSHA